MTEDTTEPLCSHPEIVAIDDRWGRCTSCGDNTFPMVDDEYEDEDYHDEDSIKVDDEDDCERRRVKRWEIACVITAVLSCVWLGLLIGVLLEQRT